MKGTVVVSCYNQKNYIKECIDSILSQKTNYEFNILVSDDCSTDGTQEIIIDYSQLYPEKIQVIARDKNVGPAVNYIEAHKAATGDIVFHCDGDDVMLPGKLQKQFELFNHDQSLNLIFHRALYFSDDGSYLAETGNSSADQNVMYFNAEDLALWGSITVHSAYAYRKSSRKVADPKREFMEWFFGMDSLLPVGRGAYINEVLVKYRCNPKGGAYLATQKGRIKAYGIYFQDLFHYFDLYPMLRKQLYANCLITALGMLKSRCGLAKKLPSFLLKNIFYFRFANFKKTLKMRTAIAPATRIR
ncbi:glycosyltransferase [Legionella brunensis]|uniref:Glycosyltransferase n=1 Tax=Legionella brunensis TaxID=29422 RepID=A0A0W0SE40_9GAMM|nr:glycosyltransferase [Legionella brunensis]KTC81409.1 glycosyltransferase [Legionella brunensis]